MTITIRSATASDASLIIKFIEALAAYEKALGKAGYEGITTEILDAPPFYYAEDYHQQYLAKNPGGYCGLGGTNVSCPGLTAA